MEHLTRWCLDHPLATCVLVALAAALAGVGVLQVEAETGYRAALGRDHAEVVRLDRFIRDFGGGLPVVVGWGCDERPDCRSALDARSLAMADALAGRIERIPGVRRVLGPARQPLVLPTGEVRTLLEHDRPADDLEQLLEQARGDPLWSGALVSEDGRAAALLVELESSDPRDLDAAVDALVAALRPHEEAGFRFALVGDPIDFSIGGGELAEEPRRLSVFTVGLVVISLLLLFRSLRVAVPVLATVGLAALLTLGLMGWLGWPENEISQAMVPLLLVVGVCDSIHFLARYGELDRLLPGAPRRDRLVATAADVSWPCTLTSATTAAGFGSFATSDLQAFVRFGGAASFGIAMALVFTFTLLPVLAQLLRIELRARDSSLRWTRATDALVSLIRRRPRLIVAGSVLLVAAGAAGMTRLEVDVSKETLMGSGSPIVRWQRWMERHLRPPDSLEIRLSLPDSVELSDPEVFDQLDSLRRFLAAQPALGRVRSLRDPVSRMHQVVADGDPAFARPGDDAAQNEQLLFALASFDKATLERWTTPDRRSLRVSVAAELLSKTERTRILESVGAHLEQTLPAGWRYELTGPLQVFAVMVEGIHSTQLRSFALAAVIIAVLVGAGLRSFSAMLWVMVPTGLPVVVTLGAMGWAGVSLDTGTAMLAAVVLGIAVDDSVHLVERYRRRRGQGREPSAAMREALEEVARPVVASSLALAVGFLSLLLSSWGSIASFGFLAAIAILVALWADLMVLPALLFAVVGSGAAPGVAGRATGHTLLDRRGKAVAIGLGVAMLAAHGLRVAYEVGGEQRTARFVCEPLPNGVVPWTAGLTPGCPLRPLEIVEIDRSPPSLEQARTPLPVAVHAEPGLRRGSVWVARLGERVRVGLPSLRESVEDRALSGLLAGSAIGLLLLTCAWILWCSSAAAAPALWVAAACASTCALGEVVGSASPSAQRWGAVALALAPAPIWHLALSFPVERSFLRLAPRGRALLYGAGLAGALAALTSDGRQPELFALVLRMALLGGAAGLALLIARCITAAWRSASALERSRARVLVAGLSLSGCGWGLLMTFARPLSLPGGRGTAAALAVVGSLLPPAYAIHRYQLFDVREDARGVLRFAVHAAIFLALLAALRALVGQWGASAGTGLAVALVAWAAAEWLHGRLWERGEAGRGRDRARVLEHFHRHRAAPLSTREEILAGALPELAAGLRARFAIACARIANGWHPVAAVGPVGTVEPDLGALCAAVVRNDEPLHLAREELTQEPDHERLRRAGIELIVPVQAGRERAALLAVGPVRGGYGSRQLAFAREVAGQLGAALHWAQAGEAQASVERQAGRSYVAGLLAHDLAKPLEVAWAVLRQVQASSELAPSLRPPLALVQARLDDTERIIDRFLDAHLEARAGRERRALGEVVHRAVAEVELRQRRAIQVRLEPALPPVADAVELETALTVVLENACQATRAGQTVEVLARSAGAVALIDVIDGGAGMDNDTRQRAFDAGFSTRVGAGGRGLGLSLCRALVAQAGGELEIVESTPRKGTRVRITWRRLERPAHSRAREVGAC